MWMLEPAPRQLSFVGERVTRAVAAYDEEILERELPPLEIRSDRVRASDAPMAPEARETLRALGYVE